jgi:hypothetical protein
MRVKFLSAQRRGLALAGTLVLALALGVSGAWAQNAEEEELPADTKFFRKLFKEFGMQRDEEKPEFRERAPLVVPPSRNLPQPQSAASVSRNPAWPNDPDVRRRNESVSTPAQKARLRGAAEAMVEEGRALRPNELNRAGGPPPATGIGPGPEEGSRPLRPNELGSKGFWDLFTSKSGAETAEFTNEPARNSLTAPPVGYQTPSSAHAYGLGVQRAEPAKPSNLWDRAAGQ